MLTIAFLVVGVGFDPASLSSAERARFDSVASEEFCACQSALTVSGCLATRPTCRLAGHLAHTIRRGMDLGLSNDEIVLRMSRTVMGPYCARAKTISADDALVHGPVDAPITVVELADFRCGHCKAAAPVVRDTVAKLGNKVRFVLVPFPLQDHPDSVAAAEAAFAAAEQGKHEAMATLLFAHEGPYTLDALVGLAQRAGLDVGRFRTAMTSHTHRAKVQRLKQVGLDAGVTATPTFFVNGRPFELDPPFHTLAHRVEMELDRDRGACQ